MSKTLSIGIVISALGFGGAAAAFGSVSQRVEGLGRTIDKLKGQQAQALRNMEREWTWGGNAVKKYAQQVDKLDKRMEALGRRKIRLEVLGQQHAENRAELDRRKGEAVAAIGMGAALAVPGLKAAQFEDRVKQISIVGELYKERGAEDAMAKAIREAAVRYAVGHDKVAEGVERLVAQGMEAKTAQKFAGLLAKVNMATRTDMGELAELVYTLQTKFKLTTEGEVMQAINALAKAGKLGQYELKQMARSFPELGGAAASFGSKGLESVREMGMMMQVMRAGAGTTGDADTNMRNWFSHMSAKTTQDHFEKAGINFEKEKLKLMIDKRVSAIEASFMVFDGYLDKVTQRGFVETRDKKGKVERVDVRAELNKVMEIARKEGLQGEALQEKVKSAVERLGLSSVLQDIQATQAYLAYRTGKEKYTEGRKELAKGDTDTTVDRDYAEQMKLATMQFQYMKVAVSDLVLEIGNRLTPVFGKVAGAIGWLADKASGLMKEWPRMTTALVGVAAVVVAAATGFLALGTAMAAFRFARTAIMLAPMLGSGISLAARGATWLGAVLRGPLLLGLRVVGMALISMGRALLFTPIGLIITGIALGAYLIYKYWGPISAWFQGLWRQVTTAFQGGVGGVSRLLINWSPLGLLYSTFSSALSRLGVTLPKDFFSFGSMLIDGLIRGITAKIGALKDTVFALGDNVKGWFAEKLGIKSPSRVFMGFGDNISEGARQGILGGVSGVQGAVSKLAGVALAGAAMGAAAGGIGGGSAGMTGSGINVTFAPNITVPAGTAGDVRQGIDQAMRLSQRELEQMLHRVLADQQRRAF